MIGIASGRLLIPSNVLSPALGFDSSYTGLLKLKPVVWVVTWFADNGGDPDESNDSTPYLVADVSPSDYKIEIIWVFITSRRDLML